jgi:hypothetical protein
MLVKRRSVNLSLHEDKNRLDCYETEWKLGAGGCVLHSRA